MHDAYELRTPEQVDLDYEVAGFGSRFIAATIDWLIQWAVILAVLLAFAFVGALVGLTGQRLFGGDGTLGVVVALSLALLLVFAITWGYFVFFEVIWNGQTPGKRAVGIRVLTTRGEPIAFFHALLRNLVRIVDFLPTMYGIGAIAVLATRRSQRLGDLAAGTIVVKERAAESPRTLPPLPPDQQLAPQQAALFAREDVALARDFLLRARDLPIEQRRRLAREIADRFRARLRASGHPIDGAADADEWVLARVAAVRR
jgi:uncharacterized RDD family membrane protein YckC